MARLNPSTSKAALRPDRAFTRTLEAAKFIPLFAKSFPVAPTYLLPAVGHYCLEDAPNDVGRLVVDFLAGKLIQQVGAFRNPAVCSNPSLEYTVVLVRLSRQPRNHLELDIETCEPGRTNGRPGRIGRFSNLFGAHGEESVELDGGICME